ncbi:MAG TPA: LptA/OstA family protein [Victivallales bacterium]|mgnify:CR=1 FL=1|nr:LptA/OstA family protein [Victivallales bacterium]HRR29493.1 LptA/OstA family protein [Victivallales bacterium]
MPIKYDRKKGENWSLLRKSLLLIFAFLFMSLNVFAQSGISFFRTTRKDGNEKKVPTVITSESLEIDIGSNKATFLNNVKVDDQEMTIECDKMLIYLEPTNKEEEKVEKTDLTSIEQNAAKQVSRIVCEGNVVITRKMPVSSENPEPIQKSKSGKADYDVKTGMIVLTENPVLIRGNDTLKGEIITIWRDSEKVRVKYGVELNINSENIKDSQSK